MLTYALENKCCTDFDPHRAPHTSNFAPYLIYACYLYICGYVSGYKHVGGGRTCERERVSACVVDLFSTVYQPIAA